MASKTSTLTRARLQDILVYDPVTGLFRWRHHRGSKPAGSLAGTIDRHGYLRITIDGRGYRAHRLAFLYMEGALPPDQVDHINGEKIDNRWANLRHASRLQNARNKGIRINNKTGFIGVSICPETKRFRASIFHDGKGRNIGRYDYAVDAARAYDAAATKQFGQFARLNGV